MLYRALELGRFVLTVDHLPGVNRYVYWLKTPLGCLLAIALSAALCGFFVASQGFVIAATIGVVIALGCVWPFVGLKGIQCEVVAEQPRGREGARTTMSVVIHNRWPWPVWGLSLEQGFAADGDDAPVTALSFVAGWSRTEYQWDFVPLLRGVYPQVVPQIVTDFPFGLWKAKREVLVPQPLLVWPSTTQLVDLPLSTGSQAATGLLSNQRAGQDGQRIGVRGYRHGDPMRAIHWVQTARQSQLMVAERQQATSSQVVLSLDVDPQNHVGDGCDSTWEAAVRLAASIGVHCLRNGVDVRLVAGEVFDFRAGGQGELALMDCLARLKADEQLTASESFHPTAAKRSCWLEIGTAHSSFSRGAQSIVVGALPEFQRDEIARPHWIAIDSPRHALEQLADAWRARSQEVASGR